MSEIPSELIAAYRARTFRTAPGLRLKDKEQAIQYVNERGFIYFWPIRDILLPSLWVAVAGDRPVADAHDDPGHITWDWKDSLLGQRRWYYAKVLRKKSTIISLEVAPYFYALSENYGAPEEDYLLQYEAGRMTQEAKQVYEALLREGPLDTLALRREARLTSPESEARFNRALADLQADFKILPVGVAEVGAWRYAFIYAIAAQHYPELPEQARFIQEGQARRKLAELYFESVGAARIGDVMKLFGWTRPQAERTIKALIEGGQASGPVRVAGEEGEWYVIGRLTNTYLTKQHSR